MLLLLRLSLLGISYISSCYVYPSNIIKPLCLQVEDPVSFPPAQSPGDLPSPSGEALTNTTRPTWGEWWSSNIITRLQRLFVTASASGSTDTTNAVVSVLEKQNHTSKVTATNPEREDEVLAGTSYLLRENHQPVQQEQEIFKVRDVFTNPWGGSIHIVLDT